MLCVSQLILLRDSLHFPVTSYIHCTTTSHSSCPVENRHRVSAPAIIFLARVRSSLGVEWSDPASEGENKEQGRLFADQGHEVLKFCRGQWRCGDRLSVIVKPAFSGRNRWRGRPAGSERGSSYSLPLPNQRLRVLHLSGPVSII